jgi:hypothetical protein
VTLEEAQEIVAKIRNNDMLYVSGPHEYGPTLPRRWQLEGAFTALELEALAIVAREHRS